MRIIVFIIWVCGHFFWVLDLGSTNIIQIIFSVELYIDKVLTSINVKKNF